jgi:DNA-3-methyladenine glycosylase
VASAGWATPGGAPEGARPEWATPLPREFYERDSLDVSPDLLNKVLVSADGRAARIIEVEAYRGADDPASHAYRGPTPRNTVMWGPAGHLYVYFTYGMHWCANVVTAEVGVAQAVLLRALDPLAGLDAMRAARWHGQKVQRDRDLCRGPGRLAEAFGISAATGGTDLTAAASLWISDDGTAPPDPPAVGPRIGISVAAERPWRYWVPGHRGVSS